MTSDSILAIAFVLGIVAAFLIGYDRGRNRVIGRLRGLAKKKYKGKDWDDV